MSEGSADRLLRPLILGLGNDILCDDGFGIQVAERLRESLRHIDVDVGTSCLAGLTLLDLLAGRENVLIIDAGIIRDLKPGELRFLQETDIPCTAHLYSQHQADLSTVLKLGKTLGIPFPSKVDILVCGAKDVVTLSEDLSPEVERAIPDAIKMATDWAHTLMKNNAYTK